MRIPATTVGAFQENCYLVIDDATGHAVLVDPGAEPDVLVRAVRDAGVTLDAIWLTHAHLDHIGGVAGVKRVWDVPVHMHPADAPLFARGAMQAAYYGIPFEQPAPPECELADGDEVRVGSLTFRVLHTPGHAPGHVVFQGEGVLLGGDLLFAGSIGRTDLPLSDAGRMERSLERVAELDVATVVYPGHGTATTIGRELESNPFLNGVARVLRR